MHALRSTVRALRLALLCGTAAACSSLEPEAPIGAVAGPAPQAAFDAPPAVPYGAEVADSDLLRAVLRAAHGVAPGTARPSSAVGPLQFEPGLYGRPGHASPSEAALASTAAEELDLAARGRALPVTSDAPLGLERIVAAMDGEVPLGQALLLTTHALHLERRCADGTSWETVATWHNQLGVSQPRGLEEFATKLEWLLGARGLRLVTARRDGMRRAWEADRRPVLRLDPQPVRVPLRLWPDGVDLGWVPLGEGLAAGVVFGDAVAGDRRDLRFRYRFVPRSERQVLDFLGSLARNQMAASDLNGARAAAPYVPWFVASGERFAAFRLRRGSDAERSRTGAAWSRLAPARLQASFAGQRYYVAGDVTAASDGVVADRSVATLGFVSVLLEEDSSDALAAR